VMRVYMVYSILINTDHLDSVVCNVVHCIFSRRSPPHASAPF
jgi:hypothetical protein